MTKKDEFEKLDLAKLEAVTGGLFGGPGLFGGGGLLGRWRQNAQAGQQTASCSGGGCSSGGCGGAA